MAEEEAQKGAMIMSLVYSPANRTDRVQTNRRLVALVVMATALALLGGGLLVGCGSDTETQESASADEQAVIDQFVAAHPLIGDREAFAALWTEDAILEDYTTNTTTEGRDQVVGYVSTKPGVSWQLSGEPIKFGDYVVQPVILLRSGNPSGQGVHVFEITGDGLIKHFWWSGLTNG